MDVQGKTTDQGPVMLGWAPVSAAGAIEETIEADPQDGISLDNATAKRPVFPLEMVPYDATDLAVSFKGEFTPRWSTPEGAGAYWFAYCVDQAGGLTTGMVVWIFAKYYGVWLRD